MEERARARGARVMGARFRWPSMRVCSRELRKELSIAGKRRKMTLRGGGNGGTKGLFVFPVQSRVSGSKYSYQWMAMAQQKGWHVLLDASAIAPKDMDSLGLSLFRPDFIIASFYKLFGSDPSGFACLFVKNSVCQTLQDPSGAPVSGMVRIIPFPCEWPFSGSSLTSSSSKGASNRCSEPEQSPTDGEPGPEFHHRVVRSFSGPLVGFGESDEQHCMPPLVDDDYRRSAFEENEIVSVGGVSRSPVFSEDGTDNLFCIDVGPSPLGTASRTSVSEDTLSEPIRSSAVQYDDDDRGAEKRLKWPANSTVFPARCSPAKKDTRSCLSTRSRIKDLCSGLLHLHTGRVVNSVESTGEDSYSPRDANKDLPSIKPSAPYDAELLEQHKSVLAESHLFKKQLPMGETGVIEDAKPDRVVVLLRKVENDQPDVDNGFIPTGLRRKEHCMDGLMVLGGEFVYPVGEESLEDQSGPIEVLETIAEMDTETEYCKSLDHEYSGEVMGMNQKMELPGTVWPGETKDIGPASELSGSIKENKICRETEGDFRLLGRRNGDRFSLGKVVSSNLLSELSSSSYKSKDFGSDFEIRSDEAYVEQDLGDEEEEPQLLCRSLDHADLLGLNKISFRLRCLINWLISSLLSLRHPDTDLSLVRIYGPQVRYERGVSFAFNLFDSEDNVLHPELVRLVADRTNVSVGVGFLKNVCVSDIGMDVPPRPYFPEKKANSSSLPNMSSKVEVVTAALGLLSDFKDVYRMWAFVSRFLDPDFVARELSRVPSLR